MIEFSRILCPVDFSEPSRAALESALMLARWYQSTVFVPHVVQIALPPAPFSPTPPVVLTPAQQEEAARQVAEFVATCGPGAVPVETSVHVGSAVAEILRQAAELPADVIVLGTHGRSGFEHLLMGSVTERVLRKAACPVLTIRPDASRRPETPPAPFASILCAVDFSPASMNALEHALSLAQESGKRLTLVYAQDWPFDVRASEVLGTDAARYQRQLHERAARELSAAVPAEARTWCQIEEVVAIGRPHEVILERARDAAADLIVMGAHGRPGLDLHVLGSTTDHVVREAACPVLTVRR
jgi:nucleotide-binding universal stress UspA family protein